MQKYTIAAAFSLALATAALAAQYYVALDSSTKQCQVVAQKPDGTSMKMIGSGAWTIRLRGCRRACAEWRSRAIPTASSSKCCRAGLDCPVRCPRNSSSGLPGPRALRWTAAVLALVALLFLSGQIWTFVALSRGDVSVATPVLGLKIIMVAALSARL